MKLPKLGDTMCKIPNTCDRRDPVRESAKCVVTYVNKEHKWYEVEFVDFGFKECFKV